MQQEQLAQRVHKERPDHKVLPEQWEPQAQQELPGRKVQQDHKEPLELLEQPALLVRMASMAAPC